VEQLEDTRVHRIHLIKQMSMASSTHPNSLLLPANCYFYNVSAGITIAIVWKTVDCLLGRTI